MNSRTNYLLNRPQAIILWIGAVLAIVVCLVPPSIHWPEFVGNETDDQLSGFWFSVGPLLTAIVIATAAGLVTFAERRERKSDPER